MSDRLRRRLRLAAALLLVLLPVLPVRAEAQDKAGKAPEREVRALLERGETQARAGQTAQAEATFKAALERDPGSVDALVWLGEITLNRKDLGLAAEYARRAKAIKPDHAAALTLEGAVLAARGQGKEAEAAWARAVAAQPTYLQAHMLLVRQFLATGRSEQAVAQFRAALQAVPTAQPVREALAHTLMNLGRNAEARDELEVAARAAPRNVALISTLGVARGRLGDTSGAREAFEQALRLDPKFAPAHMNLGDSYIVENDRARALEHYVKAGQLAPRLAPAHERAGDLYLRDGRVDEAIAAFRRAIQADDRAFTAIAQLAHLFTDYRADLPQALELAQRAEKLAPKSWLTQDSLGWVLYRMRRHDDAIRHLEAAKGLDARAGRARYHLGVAYLAAGKKEAGLGELRAALDLAPLAVYAPEAQRLLDKGGL